VTAMTGVHMLIGIGEGAITALVWLAIQRTRPELVLDGAGLAETRRVNDLVRYGLLVALGVAIFVAPFACPWPDGLDRVAAKLGFEHTSVASWLPAPAAGYRIAGVHWEAGSVAIAGAAGSLVAFGLALCLGRWLVPKGAAGGAAGENPKQETEAESP